MPHNAVLMRSITMDTVIDGGNAFIGFDDKGFFTGHGGTIGVGPINDEGVEQWIVNAIRQELKQPSQRRQGKRPI